jgi:hypothetical protein
MDVQFKNPFYHNRFGLLGDADDKTTIYTLPDNTILPSSARVVKGVSLHRKAEGIEEPEAEEIDEDPEYDEGEPDRVTPVEGEDKEVEAPIKKRAAPKKQAKAQAK